MPKVSIVIPSHNHGQFLAYAIKSALSQTYKDFEIVIVDDGSTDNTSAVLTKYEDDPRVTVFRQERKGPASARNIAIEKANGDFILPLDADDLIERSFLEDTVPVLENAPELGIAYTQWKTIGDISETFFPIDYNFLVLAYHANYIPGCSLYRKKAWKEAGGYNSNMEYGGEAWDLYIRMGEKGWFGKLVQKPLLMSRIHTESMQSLTNQHHEDIINQIVADNPKIYLKHIAAKVWFDAKSQFARRNKYPFSKISIPQLNRILRKMIVWPKPAKTPKVSIIIPCYNQSDLLHNAVDSALCQSYQSFEILIINDGSTDSFAQVVEKYVKNPKVQIINQENQGLASARNNAILAAKGEYILPLDADDMIEPTFLEKTVAALNTDKKLGVVYTYFKFFGDANSEFQQIKYDFMVLAYHGNYMTCTSLFRRKAWEDAGGYNPNMRYGYEDWDLWIGMGERGWYGKLIPLPLFLYRQCGESMRTETHKNLPETYRQIIKNHPLTYSKPISQKDWTKLKHTFTTETKFPIGKATYPTLLPFLRSILGPDELIEKNDLEISESVKGKVSVIVPCFNHAEFLRETVDSIAKQTYRNFEIIIVNDGSTDNTKEVTKELVEDNQTLDIKFVDQENIGLSGARNSGIKQSTGEFILPLDADDKIEPTMLQKTVMALKDNPKAGIAYTWLRQFGENHATWECPDFDPALLLNDNIMCACSLFRKRAWLEVGGFNESMKDGYEDWDFWISCYENGWTGKLVPEYLFLYRKHKTSMLSEANKKDGVLRAQIVANHPKLYGSVNVSISSSLLRRDRGEVLRRILICSDFFYPSVGGIELLAQDLGELFIKDGWEVEIATRDMDNRHVGKYLGMTIHEFNVNEQESGWTGNYKYLQDLVTKGAYNNVIAIASPLTWILWNVPTHLDGTNVIMIPCITKEVFDSLKENPQLRDRLKNLLVNTDTVVSMTEGGYDTKFFKHEDIPFVLIPNSTKHIVPENDFRATYCLDSNTPILLNVANYWPVKNQLAFLTQFQEFQEDCYFVLIGHPHPTNQEYYQKLVNISAQDHRVKLIPGGSRTLIADAMAAATLFLLFSKGEALPLSILHAMNSRLPWLATPDCALDGVPGGLIVPEEMYWQQVRNMLKDSDKLKALGDAGFQEWFSKHSIDVAGQKYADLFDQLDKRNQHFVSRGE